MKPNYVFGWYSPRFAIWTAMMQHGPSGRSFVRGILRWLYWCLPYYKDSYFRLLAFYLNIIRGPYACTYCGRATTHGTDMKYGIAAHCSRKACMEAAYALVKEEQ